jgi:hypothetical protein
MTTTLEARLAYYILEGRPFTADDVTDLGRIAVDASHGPNAGQSGIGSLFQAHARAGHITFTGRVVKSQAKHRKGGAIRVWEPTEAGRRWAESVS